MIWPMLLSLNHQAQDFGFLQMEAHPVSPVINEALLPGEGSPLPWEDDHRGSLPLGLEMCPQEACLDDMLSIAFPPT